MMWSFLSTDFWIFKQSHACSKLPVNITWEFWYILKMANGVVLDLGGTWYEKHSKILESQFTGGECSLEEAH